MTVHIELDAELERAIGERIGHGEFQTIDDFIKEAVRRFIAEEGEIARTEALLKEASDSGDYIELDEAEWDKIWREADEEVKARRATLR